MDVVLLDEERVVGLRGVEDPFVRRVVVIVVVVMGAWSML